jgi:ATP-binding protein involved in chromosome partitioning
MDPKIAEIEDSGKVHTDINEEMLWGKEFAAIVDSVEGFKK